VCVCGSWSLGSGVILQDATTTTCCTHASSPDLTSVCPSSIPSRPQDVEDPTERLALALGLDPRRLAVHTGVPTTDA
jgi:hypothetical protein